jgi:hypothetical protein
MVSRGKSKENDGAAQAAKAAAAVATTEEPDKGEATSKLVSIRLNEYDHRRIKSLFAKEGVPLATGIKYAALWIAEMCESGSLKVTRAGIIDRRG